MQAKSCTSFLLLLLFVLGFFFCCFFPDRVSLCNTGYSGPHSVDHTGLELRDLPAFASWMLGLKVCATTILFDQRVAGDSVPPWAHEHILDLKTHLHSDTLPQQGYTYSRRPHLLSVPLLMEQAFKHASTLEAIFIQTTTPSNTHRHIYTWPLQNYVLYYYEW